jgi:uncharacterized protein (UPF0332 family)
MPDEKSYLKWCLKQPRGVRLVKPSENLVRAYQQKSRNALKSMEVNAREGISEWAVSASYYARYFAVYALLQKVGIKSEIHDCTIALFNYLFHDNISSRLVQELRRAKEERIETQYYTREIKIDEKQLVSDAKAFVLEIERLVEELNREKTLNLQKRLKGLTSSITTRAV